MLISCDHLSDDITKLKDFCDHSKFNPKNQSIVNGHPIDRPPNELNELNRIKLKIIINSPNLVNVFFLLLVTMTLILLIS